MYCMPEGYVERVHNAFFDDTAPSGEIWQREVYEHARRIVGQNLSQVVLDIGCGSGHKLITYFSEFHTIGIDLPSTVEWLNRTYPDRTWLEMETPSAQSVIADLVICADVIEHMPDPDRLLRSMNRTRAGKIVISTPERTLLRDLQPEWRELGPPVNPAHVREWSFDEFERYIGSWFNVEEHFISNREQCTQCIVCSLL